MNTWYHINIVFNRVRQSDDSRKSPIQSPTGAVTLVPMGAMRIRISAFPVIGEGDSATEWK